MHVCGSHMWMSQFSFLLWLWDWLRLSGLVVCRQLGPWSHLVSPIMRLEKIIFPTDWTPLLGLALNLQKSLETRGFSSLCFGFGFLWYPFFNHSVSRGIACSNCVCQSTALPVWLLLLLPSHSLIHWTTCLNRGLSSICTSCTTHKN